MGTALSNSLLVPYGLCATVTADMYNDTKKGPASEQRMGTVLFQSHPLVQQTLPKNKHTLSP